MSAGGGGFPPVAERPGRDDDPRSDWLFRGAALIGAATLPLVVIAGTISDPNSRANANVNPGSSDDALLGVLIETRDEQAWASALFALAAVALWIFLGSLWARLRRGSEWLALVAVIGGVVVGAVLLFWSGVALVALVAADYGDAVAARFLMVAGWETARVAVGPALVMVGAAALAGTRYGLLPKPINVFSGVFALLLVLGLLPASPAGLMGLAVTVWVFVVALYLAFAHPRADTSHRERPISA